ncbi:50S ribosomal protein L32 [Candidatus Hodgkinia cicadicola]|nr:50S ribosomal protein L32 [Candidatus Hodgkinia cicadicola]
MFWHSLAAAARFLLCPLGGLDCKAECLDSVSVGACY